MTYPEMKITLLTQHRNLDYYKMYQSDILIRKTYTNHLQCPLYIKNIFLETEENIFITHTVEKLIPWWTCLCISLNSCSGSYMTREENKTAKFVFNGIKMNQQNKCLLAKMDILLWDRADIYRERNQDDASQQIMPIIIVSSKRR